MPICRAVQDIIRRKDFSSAFALLPLAADIALVSRSISDHFARSGVRCAMTHDQTKHYARPTYFAALPAAIILCGRQYEYHILAFDGDKKISKKRVAATLSRTASKVANTAPL